MLQERRMAQVSNEADWPDFPRFSGSKTGPIMLMGLFSFFEDRKSAIFCKIFVCDSAGSDFKSELRGTWKPTCSHDPMNWLNMGTIQGFASQCVATLANINFRRHGLNIGGKLLAVAPEFRSESGSARIAFHEFDKIFVGDTAGSDYAPGSRK